MTSAKLVKICAGGGDNRAKGMLSALSLALFRSLNSEKQSILRSAMMEDEIELGLGYDEEESDTEVETTKDQISIFRSMIQFVAKDSPSDSGRRLVNLSREIYKSTRAKGERPEICVRRFQSLAKRYLTMSGRVEAGNEGQNFAILLLENASLPSSTFNNLVSHLSSKVNSKASIEIPKSAWIQMAKINSIRTAIKNMQHLWSSHQSKILDNFPAVTDLQTHLETAMQSSNEILKAIDKKKKRQFSGRQTLEITLDDAVEALSDMKEETNRQEVKRNSYENGTEE